LDQWCREDKKLIQDAGKMKTGSTLPPGSRNRGTTVVTLDQNMVAEIGQDEGITDALTGTGLADLPCGRPR
jgi:hypothetical protein